ncbi:MAG: BamA/TamA family outer membrane protein [Desulfovermiculus sp.]|nr:BamA/TamA family outer membrane protein [Desulfovermiculus sp.]
MKLANGQLQPFMEVLILFSLICLMAVGLNLTAPFCPALAWASDLQVPYSVEFQGVKDSGLKKKLQQTSTTAQNTKTPPATLGLLRRRAKSDLNKMTEVLQAQGYFDARIDFRIEETEADKPAQVKFTVSTGPEFRIRKVDLRFPDSTSPPPEHLPNRQDLGLPPQATATADAIRQGRSILQSSLISNGYPLAQTDSPAVYVHPEQKCVDVVYPVHPGQRARYGPVQIQGLKNVKADYVRRKIPWDQGDIYNPQNVRRLQKDLLETGLFNLVQIDHPNSLNERSQLPMTITVQEVDHKRISLRLGYESDIGPKAGVSWENNNLQGKGNDLRLQLEASGIRQKLEGKYSQERFQGRNMDLVLTGSVFREDSDAFMTTGGKLSAHLEQQTTDHLRLGGGLGYKGSQVEDTRGKKVFHQFSLPAFAIWDTRDDPLDPSQGTNVNLRVTPMLGLLGEEFSLIKSSLSTRWYKDLLPDKGRAILALRGKLGIINASSTAEVPADERWYAGGGGSIRGYPYQEVGPYQDGDPFGGRSVLETSAELRWKWSDTIGSVAFVDAGNAFDSTWPDPGEKMFWGAGLGMRYYTGIGPLRLDLAFPLTSDEHIDDSFQVYISLGQAF